MLAAMTGSTTANCTASSRSDSPWSGSTTSRLRGSPVGAPRTAATGPGAPCGEVAGADEQPLGARLQPAGRERQHEMAGDHREQRVERDADRVEQVVVGGAQPDGEPGEAGRGHQRAGAVGRPPPPREQPGADERPADEQPERRGHPARRPRGRCRARARGTTPPVATRRPRARSAPAGATPSQERAALAAVGRHLVDHAVALQQQQRVEPLAQLARLGVAQVDAVAGPEPAAPRPVSGVWTSPAPSSAVSLSPAGRYGFGSRSRPAGPEAG